MIVTSETGEDTTSLVGEELFQPSEDWSEFVAWLISNYGTVTATAIAEDYRAGGARWGTEFYDSFVRERESSFPTTSVPWQAPPEEYAVPQGPPPSQLGLQYNPVTGVFRTNGMPANVIPLSTLMAKSFSIATITVKNQDPEEINEIQARFQAKVDGAFRSEEKGIWVVLLKGKSAVEQERIKSDLEAKVSNSGGQLWRNSELSNGKLYIFFTTGFPPLVIAGVIIIAILVAGWIVGQYLLSCYKLKQEQMQLEQATEDTIVNATLEEIEGNEALTAKEKVAAYQQLLGAQHKHAQETVDIYDNIMAEKKSDIVRTRGETEVALEATRESWTELLKTPMFIVAIGGILALLLLVFLKGRS